MIDSSSSTLVPRLDKQQEFWNRWNAEARESGKLDLASRARANKTLAIFESLALDHPRILEVGCGTGWLSEELARFGTVVGIDLAIGVITRARQRAPHIQFLAGDVMQSDLPCDHFDVIVCLETLSHIADQQAFIDRLASFLTASGYLILTTQNKFVFERRDDVMHQAPGQIRRWLNPREVKKLLLPRFDLVVCTTIEPAGHNGILRIVNSAKLNKLIEYFLPRGSFKSIKERAGLGQTIVVLAQKKSQSNCESLSNFRTGAL